MRGTLLLQVHIPAGDLSAACALTIATELHGVTRDPVAARLRLPASSKKVSASANSSAHPSCRGLLFGTEHDSSALLPRRSLCQHTATDGLSWEICQEFAVRGS